jgi:hypothetical protein
MEFTLKVTEKDVETIGNALAELPFKQVAALVSSLQNQINEQTLPPKEVLEEVPAPKKK